MIAELVENWSIYLDLLDCFWCIFKHVGTFALFQSFWCLSTSGHETCRSDMKLLFLWTFLDMNTQISQLSNIPTHPHKLVTEHWNIEVTSLETQPGSFIILPPIPILELVAPLFFKMLALAPSKQRNFLPYQTFCPSFSSHFPTLKNTFCHISASRKPICLFQSA